MTASADPRDARASAVALRDLGRLAYAPAWELQRALHAAVVAGAGPETLLLVEHDPVVTLGRRGDRTGILAPGLLRRSGADVVQSERGGDVTYHGPGQLVAYPILNLRRRGLGIRAYVQALEGAVLRLLNTYAVAGRRDPAMHGVFTAEGKIASVGVHVSRGVSRHGVALNVDPDMSHWAWIAPCGQPGVVAASLAQICAPTPPLADVKQRFLRAFADEFRLELRLTSAEDA